MTARDPVPGALMLGKVIKLTRNVGILQASNGLAFRFLPSGEKMGAMYSFKVFRGSDGTWLAADVMPS